MIRPMLMRHVADGIDMDQRADAGHDQQHDRGEPVHREIAVYGEKTALDPSEVMLGIGSVEIAQADQSLHHPGKGQRYAADGEDVDKALREATAEDAVDEETRQREQRYEPELHGLEKAAFRRRDAETRRQRREDIYECSLCEISASVRLCVDHIFSVFHRTDVVDIQCLPILEYRQDNRQAYGRFRRRYYHDEEGEQVAVHLLVLIGKCDEAQVHGVHDQLNRHEHSDDAAPEHEARYA